MRLVQQAGTFQAMGWASSKPYEGTGKKPCFRTMRATLPRATLCTRQPEGYRHGRTFSGPTLAPPSHRTRREPMNDELLTKVEREVLRWPGVSKETHRGGSGRGGFRVPPATVYRFGRRQLGHIHDTGVADIPFPRKIHDELISDGRAKPHAAGFAGVVSYHVRQPEDVPRVVELFRMSYERAKSAAERRRKAIGERTTITKK
jgi:Family of unknown function (DUF5519)